MTKILAILAASMLFVLVLASPVGRHALAQQVPGLHPRIQRRAVIVLPIFTQAAYGDDGFYSHYMGRCGTRCLTVPIPRQFVPSYVTGGGLDDKFLDQGIPTVTDLDVDLNPSILQQYSKVILLHNEYVSQREFEAIVHHQDVVYLYPNALYAKVRVNYAQGTITLLRGHGYPQKEIRNGFGWKLDDSKYEYNTECYNWRFLKVRNGYMLDCYPQLAVLGNFMMIQRMLAL